MQTKQRGRRFFAVLLTLAMLLSAVPLTGLTAAAAEMKSGDFQYEVLSETDKTCEITGYTGSATEIVIPSELDGYTVTSIGDWAFSDCTSLTSIVIPDGVTSIRDWAFYSCDSLSSIVIPDSVTSIGERAFRDCSSLTSIDIARGNAYYTSENGVLFNKDKTELIQYPAGKPSTEYRIPKSVTIIGEDAFYSCDSLSSIVIPDSVTSIGDFAFRYCGSLMGIDIPDSVTSIGDYAFQYCSALTSIVIPDSVTSIGDFAFGNCSALTSVTIGNGVTSIGDAAFVFCVALTSVAIGNGVISIGPNSFDGCDTLMTFTVANGNTHYTSVDGVLFNKDKTELLQYPKGKRETEYRIPSGVTSIGDAAFEYCDSLTSIAIPDSLTSIGDSAFLDCISLTSIVIPNGVTSIGYHAFEGCNALTSIAIPDSVTSIGSGVFYGTAYYDNEANWENGVLYIGNHCIEAEFGISGAYTVKPGTKTIADDAFDWCSSLTSIKIPSGVTSIGNDAFAYCDSLTSIHIPDSVTSIGERAFRDCSSLTSIDIPDSVTSIEYAAFDGCSSLTNITVTNGNLNYASVGGVLFNKDKTELLQYPEGKRDTEYRIPSGVTSIGDAAFEYCDSLTSIAVPDSLTSIGEDAFNSCSSLTSIMIPDSVTSIGEGAFNNCSSLTNINIPSGVTSIEYAAFYGCSSLTSIVIPDSVTSIGDFAFRYCGSLTSIAIPDGVTSIGDYAFADCSLLSSIVIPDSATSIGDGAFEFCPNLTFYGYADSYAETYAAENDIPFVALNAVADDTTGVFVLWDTIAPESVQLSVKQVELTDTAITYDITLMQNGVEIQPAGTVTVKIPVPDGMDGNACRVYREETDGTYTDMNAVYQDGYMVFTTDHFSVYVLTAENLQGTPGDVNADGKVDAVDARWVLQAAAGMRTLENDTAADVNSDGKIDAVDARWILQAAAGMRTLGA